MGIRNIFSDLRAQLLIATMSIGVMSVVIPYELLMTDLISYEQFDFGSTAIFCLGAFIATVVILIRSKRKHTQSNIQN
jgi:threonine/homoserine efflux transporter RhtA